MQTQRLKRLQRRQQEHQQLQQGHLHQALACSSSSSSPNQTRHLLWRAMQLQPQKQLPPLKQHRPQSGPG
jgi:hypothetical protein